METIDEIVTDYEHAVKFDYIGLWEMPGRVTRALGVSQKDEVRKNVLLIVQKIVEQGLRPGDYRREGFFYWKENDVTSILSRIEAEWDQLKDGPDLPTPICWFGHPNK